MTSNKTPREGWLEIKCEGIDSEGREFFECDMYFEPVEGLTHIKEVAPDEVSDGEMLQFMIENEYYCAKNFRTYGVFQQDGDETYIIIKGHKTPREAIRAAMREKKERG